jgi:hypothetical protein
MCKKKTGQKMENINKQKEMEKMLVEEELNFLLQKTVQLERELYQVVRA